MQDTGQLLAYLLLAAFAIERIVAAARFALQPEPEAGDGAGQRRRQLLLFGVSAAVALAIVDHTPVRIIERVLQPRSAAQFGVADYWLTWLVLVAGTDRMKELMQSLGVSGASKAEKTEVPPIRVVMDDGAAKDGGAKKAA